MLGNYLIESDRVFIYSRVLVLGNASEIELSSSSSSRLPIIVWFSFNKELNKCIQDLDRCSPAVKVIISFTSNEADFNDFLNFVGCAEIIKEFLVF